MQNKMCILGIETSCDDTGIALYDSKNGLINHKIYSQIKMHAQFGGVVPELASRDHVQKILPLLQLVLESAHFNRTEIDGIAYTAGPGLIGALLVGATVAHSLAFAWDIPCLGVHHLEGHLLAPMLEKNPPAFPFVALLVSGGHTQLMKVEGIGHYTLLGESRDDAAGEAFDKTAKLLGLDYPGGPALALLAEKGNPNHFYFPRPMLHHPSLDFSFSGLKTHVATLVQNTPLDEQTRADIAYAFQEAVVDTLVAKCVRALEETHLKTIIIAGGVSANTRLRTVLTAAVNKIHAHIYYARPEFCVDNGAMIAYAGCQRLLRGEKENKAIRVYPRWDLTKI